MLVWILVAIAVVSVIVAMVAKAWGPNRKLVETAGPTFVEKFNQAIRALVLIALTGGFVWAFIMGLVSSEVFSNTFSMVLGYWFASREAKARYQEQPTTVVETPSAKTTTGPTPPLAG